MVYVLKTMAQIREEVESPQGLVHDKFVPIASVSIRCQRWSYEVTIVLED